MERILVVSMLSLWVLVLLNMLVTLALVRRMNSDGRMPHIANQSEGIAPGEIAPDFKAETLSGEPLTLASFNGRTTAFLFIGTHCPPCREAIPSYEATRLEAMQAGVELVLVSVDDAAQSRTFADEIATSLPILIAPRESNSFMSDYKLSVTPSYCLIDPGGKVKSSGYPLIERGMWRGWMDSHDARNGFSFGSRRRLTEGGM